MPVEESAHNGSLLNRYLYTPSAPRLYVNDVRIPSGDLDIVNRGPWVQKDLGNCSKGFPR